MLRDDNHEWLRCYGLMRNQGKQKVPKSYNNIRSIRNIRPIISPLNFLLFRLIESEVIESNSYDSYSEAKVHQKNISYTDDNLQHMSTDNVLYQHSSDPGNNSRVKVDIENRISETIG